MKKCVLALALYLAGDIAFGWMSEVYAQARFRQLMQDKLRNAQKLLEGLAMARFEKINESAEELIRLSKQAEWLEYSKSPRYEMYTNDFRRAVERVLEKSRAKNIDGVALAYVDVTLSCVRCHQFVRETRDARAPRDFPVIADSKPATPPSR